MTSANDNSNMNKAVVDKGYFCPSCGGALVEVSSLAGGAAKCGTCTWEGRVEDLAVVPFEHGFTSQEEVLRAFFLDIRKFLATQAVLLEFGRLLIKWGFLKGTSVKGGYTIDPKEYARYVGAMAKAVVSSVVEVRAEIEREKHRDGK